MCSGLVIEEYKATDTFIKILQYIGLEKISQIPELILDGQPLVSSQRNDSAIGGIHEVDGFFINTHSNTKLKEKQIRRIAKILNINLQVEIVEK